MSISTQSCFSSLAAKAVEPAPPNGSKMRQGFVIPLCPLHLQPGAHPTSVTLFQGVAQNRQHPFSAHAALMHWSGSLSGKAAKCPPLYGCVANVQTLRRLRPVALLPKCGSGKSPFSFSPRRIGSPLSFLNSQLTGRSVVGSLTASEFQ